MMESCFGVRRTKRSEVYLSLFEKKIIRQMNTRFIVELGFCVAENRFFSNWSFAFELLQVSDG